MSLQLVAGVERIVGSIRRLLAARDSPVLVAVDGPSGSGKSTVAIKVAEQTDAALVHGDDFFAAGITNSEWDRFTPAERVRDAIDWRKLRAEALEPLMAGERAEWHPFDFSAGPLPDGTYGVSDQAEAREPAPVIILDGAYSARPELADLFDLTVLVSAPAEIRHARLAQREDPDFLAEWHQRWDEAEGWYFSRVRPSTSFDIIIQNV